MSAVFEINKGICQPIQFKGIKAQYLIFLAAGMLLLLLLFFGMFAIGINIYICLIIVLPAGTALVLVTQHYSKQYGANGLERLMISKRFPSHLCTRSRNAFLTIYTSDHEKKEDHRRDAAHLQN